MFERVKNIKAPLGIVIAVSLGCCVASCDPELETISWEPIDYRGVLDALDNPTGTIVDDSFQDTIEAIKEANGFDLDEAGGYLENSTIIYRQVETVVDVVAQSDGGDPDPDLALTEASDELNGINVFARKSCIGPDPDNPNYDFEFGEIRLESSPFGFEEFAEEGVRAQIVGHIFTQWVECRYGDVVVTGEGPGFISDAQDEIVLDLDLLAERGDEVRRIAGALRIARDSVDVLVETEPGVTYVLGITVGDETEFRLGTANGFFICTFAQSGLSCVEPEPDS